MKCVILQPSYIPWRGFFHQIQKSDLFVFYDDVQYDKRGWRNRNRIKTPNGSIWLTVPVNSRGAQIEHTPIHEVPISWETSWNEKHLTSLKHSYGKAPYFEQYMPMLQELYQKRPEMLADFTVDTTIALARALGIEHTQFIRSSTLGVDGTKTERLLNVLKAVGADHYISGPSARDYIDDQAFADAGITLEYMSYDYPEYEQLHPPFDPQVSVLDLLFMKGDEAHQYIW